VTEPKWRGTIGIGTESKWRGTKGTESKGGGDTIGTEPK
jgi:hypothetical protein